MCVLLSLSPGNTSRAALSAMARLTPRGFAMRASMLNGWQWSVPHGAPSDVGHRHLQPQPNRRGALEFSQGFPIIPRNGFASLADRPPRAGSSPGIDVLPALKSIVQHKTRVSSTELAAMLETLWRNVKDYDCIELSGASQVAGKLVRDGHLSPRCESLAPLFDAILRRYVGSPGDFKVIDSSQLLSGFVYAERQVSPSFADAVARSLLLHKSRMSPRNWANNAWHFGKLCVDPLGGGFIDYLLEHVSRPGVLAKWEAHDVTNLVWTLATLDRKVDACVLDIIASRSVALVESSKPQHLSNVVWAFARLEHDALNGALFHAFAQQVVLKAQRLNDQHVANVAWAFAKLENNALNGRLFEALERETLARLEDFGPQELANIWWAFAKMQYISLDGRLFESLARECMKRLSSFQPVQLVMIIQAMVLAELNPMDGHFRNEIFALLQPTKLCLFKVDEHAGLWGSLTKLDCELPASLLAGMWDSVYSLLVNHSALPSSHRFSLILWALSKHRYRPNDEQLQFCMRKCLPSTVDDLTSEIVGQVLLGCAKLMAPIPTDKVVQLVEHAFANNLDFQCLRNSVWAMLCLGILPSYNVLKQLAREFDRPFETFDVLELQQLHQINIGVQLHDVEGNRKGWVDDDFLKQVVLVLEKEKRSPSPFQKQVFGYLVDMGVPCVFEDKLPGHQLSVDIGIRGPLDVAIEVDGPSHYSCNEPFVVMGETVFRDKLLRWDGYHVIKIPFYEWQVLPNRRACELYLVEKLRTL